MSDVSVVVITPAHNEAEHIAGLVASMAAQTRRPDAWVIVDDASTDGTGDTARRAAADLDLDWVEVISRTRAAGRSFSAKAAAVAVGWEHLADRRPDVVAVIDADLSLPADFFATVLAAFADDPSLGVTGGRYEHRIGGRVVQDQPPLQHVPGPSQTFRREVWEAIGGYRDLPFGGVDTAANVDARRDGWTTRHIPTLLVHHARRMGTGGGVHPVVAEFRKGRQDHDLATDPLFEAAKLARRLSVRPRIIGALARAAGYLRNAAGRRRTVDDDFAAFVRAEQRSRLRSPMRGRSR
ncbi:MAG: glycosyltransferase [Actinomycetota bacterium]